MTLVTLRILEGMERGCVYSKMPLPVTIGREEDNDIQLNDDRVSRFHSKLQDHAGRIILTDLDSTNGTRVNGHPIQMRVMQHGDVIGIGRCVVLFQQNQGEESLTDLDDPRRTTQERFPDAEEEDLDIEFGESGQGLGAEPGVLFPQGRPELPANLTGLQRVQLSDLMSYIHEQLGLVVKGATEDLHGTPARTMRCGWDTWTRLVSLQADLAQDIRTVNNPED
jgi:hypothetical protein